MSPSDLNLRHLRILAAAVRLGGFSAAGKAVGVSQPAVTQAIGRLEAMLGMPLIERGDRRFVPLDAGILLAARAEAADAALGEAFRSPRKGGIGGRAGAAGDITTAQLTALLAVADHGSYAGGAQALGLTQPSLHRAVAELERLSGLALVERSGRGVALTAAGERLASAARLAFAELRSGLDELAVLGGRDQGTIRIGSHPAALARLLPRAIAAFVAEHPPVVIEVQELDGARAAEQLRQGRIDAALVLDCDAIRDPAFHLTPLAEEPFVVAARAGHPLLVGPMPGAVRLAQAGWAAAPAGQEERGAWEGLFLDGGLFPPQPSVTLPALPALLDLTARSDLLTVAPQGAIAASGGRLVALGPPLTRLRRLVLATRTGWAPTPAQATFLADVSRAASGAVMLF